MTHAPNSSRAAFPQTAWNLIRQTQDLSVEKRQKALEKLLRTYWKPIYAYYRSKGKSRHDAEDLVQSFLHDFVRDEKILQVDQQLGKFRTWLRKCLDNHLISWERKAGAQKRRPAEGVASFEQLELSDGQPFEPSDNHDPDTAMADAWRRDLLRRAIQSVADQCEADGRQVHYNAFVAYYCNTSTEKVTWKQIAEQLELPSWKDATRKADWIKEQLGRAIRRHVAEYTDSDDEIDEELLELYD